MGIVRTGVSHSVIVPAQLALGCLPPNLSSGTCGNIWPGRLDHQPVDAPFLLDEWLFVDTEIVLIGLLVVVGLINAALWVIPTLGTLMNPLDRVLARAKLPPP
jgi:hypothetical protein